MIRMQTFDVFINTGCNNVCDHKVVIRARNHGEALDQSLLILNIDFDQVLSASVTPQKNDTEFLPQMVQGCSNPSPFARLKQSTNVRSTGGKS